MVGQPELAGAATQAAHGAGEHVDGGDHGGHGDSETVGDRLRLRRLLLVIFVVGGLHAGLYAVSFPPWAIEDEEQHVDYIWKLAFDHRMPDLDDPLEQSVVDSAASTDRWGDYDLPQPPSFDPEAMGFEGYSYESYHPPLVYTAVVPVALVVGDRALVLMYVLRAVSTLTAGAVCALSALLAWMWCRDPSRRHAVARAAGLAVAALPAVADSGGRVNLDIFAALFVLLGVLLIGRWLDRPTSGRAWAVGTVLAMAALARETTVVLAVAVVAAGIVAVRHGGIRPGDVTRALGPPALAWIAWSTYFWQSTGYLDPSEALRDRLGAHHPYQGIGDFLRDLGDRAFVPYGDWALPEVATAGLALVALVGLALAARHGAGRAVVVAAGALVVAVALLFQQAQQGSTTVTARLLLPAYPLVLAAATVGWGMIRRRWGAAVVPTAVGVLSLWFLLGSFLPEHPPSLG